MRRCLIGDPALERLGHPCLNKVRFLFESAETHH
jgi:hypothetical protein